MQIASSHHRMSTSGARILGMFCSIDIEPSAMVYSVAETGIMGLGDW